MSRIESNLNRIRPEPSTSDVFSAFKREIFLSMNCHGIATVKSFNPENQTVRAKMNYQKTFVERDSDGVYKKQAKDYPLMLDVPVVVLKGGGFSQSFPIKEGDDCLILFNDRDIDNWWSSGQKMEVATPRLHSFSDAIAIVGLSSEVQSLEEYDPENYQVTNGDLVFQLGANNKAKIANSSKSLKDILSALVDAVSKLQVVVAGGNHGVAPTTANALNEVKSDLGELLE